MTAGDPEEMASWNDQLGLSRAQFLNLAGLFQTGMVGFALLLSWVLGVDPLVRLLPRWDAIPLSFAGLVPLLVFFAVTFRFPVGGFGKVREFLLQSLGPLLVRCSVLDLFLLAGMVGVSEELLFRGVLQPWLSHWGFWFGLLASGVIFGLVHAVTPTYAIVAGGIGIYLGTLLEFGQPPNLVVPMVVHGLYDWVAFLVVRREYSRRSVNTE